MSINKKRFFTDEDKCNEIFTNRKDLKRFSLMVHLNKRFSHVIINKKRFWQIKISYVHVNTFSIEWLIAIHFSSIVNKVIRTISIFFKKHKINNFPLLEVFLREKLLPLLFFVCSFLFCWLVLV